MKNLSQVLAIGGKSNSLGKVNEVIAAALQNKALLAELYSCLFAEDAWVRMRAADALEKVCREHPEWIEPYIDGIQAELSDNSQQASIKWHMAQIYQEVALTETQKQHAIHWLSELLATNKTDWIVAANAMSTLVYFTKHGDFAKETLLQLLKLQLRHTSPAVVKKASKYLAELA